MEKKYALIIGNSEYRDPSLIRLKAPDVDVQSLADVLRDPKIGCFDQVEEVINQTFAIVSRAISDFFKDKKREDMLLLYFSGHGVQDANGRLYLAVKDSEKDYLDSTAVGTSFINEKLTSCRSRRKILILDCCHSGAWQVGAKGETAAVTADTFQGYGQVVMTASDKTEYALEGDQVVEDVPLSLFTNYLLEGLKTGKADKLNDNWITAEALFDYARDQVIGVTANQRPKIWKYDMERDLRIAHNPFPKEVKLPAHLYTMIANDLPSIRVQAIDELVALLDSSIPEMAGKARQALEQMAVNDDSSRVRESASAALQGRPLTSLPKEPPVADERMKRLEAHHASALAAMQQGHWEEAQNHLREIERDMPEYKDVHVLLKQVSVQIDQARSGQIASLYDQAMQAVQGNNWLKAQSLLQQLETMQPGYRDVRQQLTQVAVQIQRQQRLQDLYDQALQAINGGNWVEARTLLMQIQQDTPLYRDVPNLLMQINQKTSPPPKRIGTGKTFLIGIVIGVGIMLCLCVIAYNFLS